VRLYEPLDDGKDAMSLVSRPGSRRPPTDWTSEVSSAYALAGFLFVAFVGLTLLVMGPLVGLDASLNVRNPPDGLVPMLHVLDRMGGRLVALPVLGLVLLWIHRRTGRLRPLVVAVVAVLGMILVVGCLKLGLGRGKALTFDPNFFTGGISYPSGHTSNVMLVYGLVPYLLSTYAQVPKRVIRVLIGVLVLLSVWMVAVSVTLSWHWFGDLWAGLLIGGMSLALTSAIDHSIPRDVFDAGIRPGLKRIPALVLRRRDVTSP